MYNVRKYERFVFLCCVDSHGSNPHDNDNKLSSYSRNVVSIHRLYYYDTIYNTNNIDTSSDNGNSRRNKITLAIELKERKKN